MSYRYVIPKDCDVQNADLVVKDNKSMKLARHDQYLRTFQHTKALDAVLSHFFTAKRPEVTISVIRELIRRRALTKALAGRSDDALQPIIALIITNISRTPFTSTMIDVGNDLIELYKDKLNELNDKTKRLSRRMNSAINLEVAQMKEMLMLKGSLDVVMNMTPYRPSSTTDDDDDGAKRLKDLLRAEKSCKLNKNKYEIFKTDSSSWK